MATSTASSSPRVSAAPGKRRRPDTNLDGFAVSRYDMVSGLLLAAIVFVGFLTTMMFLIWLSSQIFWVAPAVPVMVLEDVGGGGSGSTLGSGPQDFEEPSPEELQEIEEEPITEESILAITSVVSTEVNELDALEGDTSIGQGEGTGTGDGRGPGPGGPGTSDGIPAWERWEVRMTAKNLDEYARQLDFFKVELGVAGGGNPNVEYISNLAAAKPTVRIGNPKDEKRLNFLHRTGELRAADRQLAAKAGVQTDGRVVFQFYAPETYTNLLTLENIRMGSRRIKEVRKTIFGVRGTAGRYEFHVIDQQYVGG
jgi:hypothetical protein